MFAIILLAVVDLCSWRGMNFLEAIAFCDKMSYILLRHNEGRNVQQWDVLTAAVVRPDTPPVPQSFRWGNSTCCVHMLLSNAVRFE
ncbi:uncharacterized protein V6R79_002497 [Siganus canaliculatus]